MTDFCIKRNTGIKWVNYAAGLAESIKYFNLFHITDRFLYPLGFLMFPGDIERDQ